MDQEGKNQFSSQEEKPRSENFEDDFRNSLNTDVVIQNGPRRRNKKVGIIALALILLVAVVVALVTIPKNKAANVSDDEIERTFLRYANSMLNGSESTNAIEGEYNTENNYNISVYLKDRENTYEKISQNDKTKETLRSYIKRYESSENLKENRLFYGISKLLDLHEYVELLSSKDPIRISEIAKKYLDDGRDAASTYASEYYKTDIQDNEYITAFLENLSGATQALLDNYDIYKNNKCISDDSVQYSCFKKNASAGDIYTVDENNKKIQIINNVINSYEQYCANYLRQIFYVNDIFEDKLETNEDNGDGNDEE